MSESHLKEIIKSNILEQEPIEGNTDTEEQLKAERKQSNQGDDQFSSSEEPPSTTICYEVIHNEIEEQKQQNSSVQSKKSYIEKSNETPIKVQPMLIQDEYVSTERKDNTTLTKKRNRTEEKKKYTPNIEGVVIPKMKNLNVEKKKHRIQFQKNHRKTIYSYFSLAPPFDFNELFKMILKHQETHGNDKKKSFHFIRELSGKVHIVTFDEKKEFKSKGNLMLVP